MELKELGNKKEKRAIIIFGAILLVSIIIVIANSVTSVNLNMSVLSTGTSFAPNSQVSDYLITSDDEDRLQIKFRVDNPINDYMFCFVLDVNQQLIDDTFCILPLNTQLGIIDVPRQEDYILRLYTPLRDEVQDIHLSITNLRRNNQADLTDTVLNREELESTSNAVMNTFINNNQQGFVHSLMGLSNEKERILGEINTLNKDIARYKDKDRLNHDNAVTVLFDREQELQELLQFIEDNFKHIIEVLNINPELYTLPSNNYSRPIMLDN